MKSLLRSYLITLGAIYLATIFIKGFIYQGGITTLLIGAAAFTVINWFVKPVVKILMLPFSLITLGLFSWIVNVLMLYLLTKIVTEMQIKEWLFSGMNIDGFIIPSYNFNILMTFIVTSFVIALVSNFLHWLTSK